MDHVIPNPKGHPQASLSAVLRDPEELKKLPELNLPFREAWIVKVVQAGVALGSKRLRISQKRSSTRIVLEGAKFPPDDLVQRALAAPGPCGHRGLEHLITGLREVGMLQGRNFRLSVSAGSNSLSWNGEEMSIFQAKDVTDPVLEVDYLPSEVGKVFFLNRPLAAGVGLLEADAVRDYCFTCPIPLLLDGTDCAGLLNLPASKPYFRVVPISLTFPPLDLPVWSIPPNTFPDGYNPGVKGWSSDEHKEEVNAAILISCSFWRYYPLVDFAVSRSSVFWLHDGVVVDKQDLGLPSLIVSAQLFLSTRDLELEPNGFSVRAHAKKQSRVEALVQATGELLGKLHVPFGWSRLDHLPGFRTKPKLVVAKTLGVGVLGTIGLLAALPLAKVIGIGALASGVAGVGLGLSVDLPRLILPGLRKHLKELVAEWNRRYSKEES